MTATAEAFSTVVDLDRRLSAHPDFGNDDLIIARAHGRLRLMLDFVISRSGALADRRRRLAAELGRDAAESVSAAYVDNPIVKLQLENEARRWHYGSPRAAHETPAAVESVLLRALEAYANVPSDAPDRKMSLVRGPGAAADPLAADLEAVCQQYLVEHPDTHGRLLAIDVGLATKIKEAMQLAGELLPMTAVSALRHIRAIAVVDARTADGRLLSASGGDPLPGTVLLDSRELANVWHAAVRLVHEALHLKLFEISRATSIVGEPIGMVTIPWRLVDWEIRRVFAAFHVYAHLVVLHRAIDTRPTELVERYGDPPGNAGVSRATANTDAAELGTPIGRASWLGRQLLGPLRPTLTRDGLRMLLWLVDTVRPLLDVRGAPVGDGNSEHFPKTPSGPAADLRLRRAPDLLRREIPSAATLAVLNPSDRSVHTLNLDGWLTLELCDGRGWPDLLATYRAVVTGKVPPGTEQTRLESAVRELQRVGLVTSDGP